MAALAKDGLVTVDDLLLRAGGDKHPTSQLCYNLLRPYAGALEIVDALVEASFFWGEQAEAPAACAS